VDCSSFFSKAYFLDFAGGGAVHLLGIDIIILYSKIFDVPCKAVLLG